MSWTWCKATAERPISLEQHKQVEADVEEDIRAFIQQRYPSTTDLFCKQLYTEDLQNSAESGTELVAHFRCQAAQGAADDASEQIFEGFLRLKSDDFFETWTATGGEIRASELRFLNGVKVSPSGAETTPEAKTPQVPDAAKPAKKH
jgi:hypothetical protein